MAAEKLTLNTSRVTKNELYMNYNNALDLKKKLSTQLNKISATLNKLNKVLNKAVNDETVKGSATWAKTVKTAAQGCLTQAKRAETKNKRLETKFNNDSLQFLEEVLGGKYGQVDQSISDLNINDVGNLDSKEVENILSNANVDTSTNSNGEVSGNISPGTNSTTHQGQSYNLTEEQRKEVIATVYSEASDKEGYMESDAMGVASTIANRADGNGGDMIDAINKGGYYGHSSSNAKYMSAMSNLDNVPQAMKDAVDRVLSGERNTTATQFTGNGTYNSFKA